jgi:Reverse transcriptase (RNA-dependent DNA polymerase)
MTKLILSHLLYVESNNQYGFQKNSSTSAAVINLVSGIISGLDGKKTASLFIDLRKAFDCINHEILLRHLIDIGITGKVRNSEKFFDDLYVSMSHDLKILKQWLKTNRLSINAEKTKFIIFETKNANNLDPCELSRIETADFTNP